ncbi:MAG: hypothetical protein JZU45_13745 [Methyloversatilis discipulorum]|uniref:formyltransferase family protein n=1 Tax=Methyloversatilis discipulorum TaxID=1119528 RepID=UPI0026EAB0B8|nr:formyltransferase family protein [Methyloversatilis discipulorum]MBV5287138.1 hypothetical protein [Methyloversatilis discipulorum]
MKIAVLCTDCGHPVFPYLQEWVGQQRRLGHETALHADVSQLGEGELLFLVSCAQLVPPEVRNRFGHVLVLHASDLPDGRGWSPHVWSIVEGAKEITLCLLEAVDPVDTGPIWLRERIALKGTELLPDINRLLFAAELRLMTRCVEKLPEMKPEPQADRPGRYFRRRTAEDSRIDPARTLAEQFDLLRVVDNDRYPAFFDFRGERYLLKIEKVSRGD